jgi:predicted nuclease of restriction endonuclease-like (RecB) superfamily
MNFNALVHAIADIHRRTQSSVAQSVNIALTYRNWLIGAYIHEYELQGQDRAEYGEQLIKRLADALRKQRVPACERPRLYAYLSFYRVYPQIREALSQEWESMEISTSDAAAIFRSVTGKSTSAEGAGTIVRSMTGISPTPGRLLVEHLSYTHLELLTGIDDPLKRAFYEIESIKGNWAVRELKRQIGSLYFERSGLSHNKERLSEIANAVAAKTEPKDVIRDPYVFEFLGLRPQEVLPESDLESALIEKLQNFLLELGHGFCFEGRQKRLNIGGEAFFVDLVFYHRVLKCHVLVELKVDEFRHEHLGQLNTYVSYYRAHEMTEGDQPPVGILLCTGKNHALVEYALAGMDNRLFVSKYQLQLPKPDELQRYIEAQRRLLEAGGKKCSL